MGLEPRTGSLPADLRARQPQAVRSALAVLQVVADLGPGTTAQEISSTLAMSRATAYRLVGLLAQEGFLVRRTRGHGLALGWRARQLSEPPHTLNSTRAVRSELESTRSQIRDGLHLIVFSSCASVVVDEDPDRPMPEGIQQERRLDRTPCGLLLLAHLAEHHMTLDSLVGEVGPTALDDSDCDLWKNLGQARDAGVVRVTANSSGRRALAVPVYGQDRDLAAALVLFTPVGSPVPPDVHLSTICKAADRLAPLLA